MESLSSGMHSTFSSPDHYSVSCQSDTDPTRFLTSSLLQSCLGGMLFGMDTGTIGGVIALPAFQKSVTPFASR